MENQSYSLWKRIIKAMLFYGANHVVAHIPFYGIRHLYYRYALRMKIGKKAAIHMNVFLAGNKIEIGNNTIVNRQCYVDGRVGVSMGSNVSISPQVMILSLAHDKNSSSFDTIPARVVIEDYVWVGARATILPGIVLGYGCIVAAGAVVTRNVSPYSIVAGVPAKVIGQRTAALSYMLDYRPWFDSDIL